MYYALTVDKHTYFVFVPQWTELVYITVDLCTLYPPNVGFGHPPLNRYNSVVVHVRWSHDSVSE